MNQAIAISSAQMSPLLSEPMTQFAGLSAAGSDDTGGFARSLNASESCSDATPKP
jgi:hypothetical protein